MNRRVMDMLMRRGGGRDGRNPYGSAGGYVVSSRRGRRDRAMEREDMRRRDYEQQGDYRYGDMARGRMSGDMARGRGRDMGYGQDYADYDYEMRGRGGDYYGGMDGNYGGAEGKTYYPIEAMGTFNGYYGMPQQDYARGGRRDYAYGYDYADDYARGDFGETLTHQELDRWSRKLMDELEDKDKQFFSRENVMKKAQDMGIKFDKFNEDEFYLTTLMMYTDYCKTLGTANMEIYLRLAKDWLEDKDVSVKGGEKLAVYHDCIVQGD